LATAATCELIAFINPELSVMPVVIVVVAAAAVEGTITISVTILTA